jgi:1-deoxy-D-xylulose-5-phosphate synthase
VAALEEAFRNAAQIGGPQVVHVLTQKGRATPAENDPIKRLRDIGLPKPGSYTAAFTEALIEAEVHPEVVAIAAMPDSTGLLPSPSGSPTAASTSASPSSTR